MEFNFPLFNQLEYEKSVEVPLKTKYGVGHLEVKDEYVPKFATSQAHTAPKFAVSLGIVSMETI